MMRALILLLCLLSAQAWGADRYVDCSSGTNGAGTTFTDPYNAIASVNFTTVDTNNESVRFKGWTTCVGQINLTSTAGTSGTHIVLGVYDAATGAAVTDGSQRATINANNSAGIPVTMFGVSWIDVIGLTATGSSSAAFRGQFDCNTCNDVTFQYITATPGNGNDTGGIDLNKGNRLAISNCTISGVDYGVILYGSAAGTYDRHSVTNCTISTINAAADVSNASGITMQYDQAATYFTNATITGNTIRSVGNYPLETHGYGIRVGGPCTSCSITNNTISNVGIAGILNSYTGPSAVADTSCAGTVISGNTIKYAGRFGFWNTGCSGIVYGPSNITSENGANSGTKYGRGFEIVAANATIDSTTAALAIGAGYDTLGATGVTFTATNEFATKTTAMVGQTIISTDVTNPGVALVTSYVGVNQVNGTILSPFISNSESANAWVHAVIPTNVVVKQNEVYNSKNYIANCSEGSGISPDDYASLMTISSNYIHDNEGAGIDIYRGVRNKAIGNVLLNNGSNCRSGPVALTPSVEIKQNGVDSTITNNTVVRTAAMTPVGWDTDPQYCLTCGIRNSGTPVSTFTAVNNFFGGFYIGMWKSAADVETNNRFFGNTGFDVRRNDNAVLTIDATSAVANPGFAGGAAPTTIEGFRLKSTSPLRRVGKDLNIGNYQDAGNRAFMHPPSIGAWEATSGDAAPTRAVRP